MANVCGLSIIIAILTNLFCISDAMSYICNIMSQIKNLQYRIAQAGDAAPRKSDKTRQAILAAALKYLWTHPY
jgi:Na+-transporting methylmalonyl-CoA/oxaloacetate decarboxylase gamma subunit